MKIISTINAQKSFANLLVQIDSEPVTVMQQHKEVAVILSSKDFHQLLQAAKQSVEAIKEPKTLIDFLGAGKSHSRFSSMAEIDAFVTENREEWRVNYHAAID